jgi:hypothetical protein
LLKQFETKQVEQERMVRIEMKENHIQVNKNLLKEVHGRKNRKSGSQTAERK